MNDEARKKISKALKKAHKRNPQWRYRKDRSNGHVDFNGIGERHLELLKLVDKMLIKKSFEKKLKNLIVNQL